MKRVAIGICLALAIVATANLFLGRAQEAGMRQRQPPSNGATASNPLKVALLKWYAANQSTPYDGVLFEVCNLPYGVVFDGDCIWTANSGDGTVTKLRASDGEIIGTFKVGGGPVGVAFDGANIWATNSNDGTVTKLRASDGKALGTFPV